MQNPTYRFKDGNFQFYTAHYGSWARNARVVFRVRTNTTPKKRAAEKDIKWFDRLIWSTEAEINLYLKRKNWTAVKVENA